MTIILQNGENVKGNFSEIRNVVHGLFSHYSKNDREAICVKALNFQFESSNLNIFEAISMAIEDLKSSRNVLRKERRSA